MQNAMNASSRTAPAAPPHAVPAAARAAFALLRRLQVGTLDLQLPDGAQARFGSTGAPRAALRVHDWRVFAAVLRRGDIGFAEGWIDGGWTSPDLVALLTLLNANREALDAAVYGRWWASLADRLRHLLNRNSRRGSRRNIAAHYDLGNAFYAEWLDPTLSYSAACFDGDRTRPLEQAQHAKMRRALAACGVQPGQRLLEIGCGWGALAETAAREHGARVTGITLSAEQLAHARSRIDGAGLAGAVTLRLQDWRDLPGSGDAPFDAIVSIEMFEAVGRAWWGRWFAALRAQLRPGARACVQTITIRDDLFARYCRGTDFIQQFIFPGGLLPSPAAFRAEAARAGLDVVDEHAFGADYAETLARWRAAFLAREAAVRRQGFDTRFVRTWDFYLAYCEAAFASGSTDVIQFTLRRPQ